MQENPTPAFDVALCGLLELDARGRVARANATAAEILGREGADLEGQDFFALASDETPLALEALAELGEGDRLEGEYALRSAASPVPVALRLVPKRGPDGALASIACAFTDLRELRSMDFKLGQAQQMASVGRIAAGIAHEINTPVQFIGDSVGFLQEAYEDLHRLIDAYKALAESARDDDRTPELISKIDQLVEETDLEFLEEEIPASLARTREGVGRVAEIARAIKQFSYPDQREKEAVDLNSALSDTITIARNEYKYVADLEKDFGDLPPVFCHAGDLNQVFLNLIINAAHAIEDARSDDRASEKGRITVSTRAENETVTVAIADTGCGIPDEIRESIFDAFFTTKEVGRGTGQGLALARSVVVDKHGGTLSCESEVGKGTRFLIRLPIDGRVDRAEEDAS